MVCIVLLGAIVAGGCRGSWPLREAAPVPPAFAPTEINLATVADAINANTANVRQLESDVRINLSGLPTAISGTMIMERPDRMRLQAGLLGMNDLGVDIGSNRELFWIWSKATMPGQQAAILYARHDEFANSEAGRQMRLQPRWIVDALGLIELADTHQHEGPYVRPDKRLEIRSYLPHGADTITRVAVVHPQYGWVEQLAYYDDQGALMAYANAVDYRYHPDHQASLPNYIELHVFPVGADPIKLSINLRRVRLNALYVDEQRVWALPQHADVPLIDITQVDPSQLLGSERSTQPAPTAMRRSPLARDRSHMWRR